MPLKFFTLIVVGGIHALEEEEFKQIEFLLDIKVMLCVLHEVYNRKVCTLNEQLG